MFRTMSTVLDIMGSYHLGKIDFFIRSAWSLDTTMNDDLPLINCNLNSPPCWSKSSTASKSIQYHRI